MLLPLTGEPGTKWPEQMSVLTESGAAVTGSVAFLIIRRDEREPFWTQANPFYDAVPPSALAAELTAAAAPVLLIALPENSGDTLRLGDQVLRPRWVGPFRRRTEPQEPTAHGAGSASSRAAQDPGATSSPGSFDTPDPVAPREMFRWDMLAGRDGVRLPSPPEEERSRLLGEHYVGLWRAAMSRLGDVDSEVESQLCDLMCGSARGFLADGRDLSIAAWRQRDDEADILLSMILDFERSDEDVVRSVQAWMGACEGVVCWIESRLDDGALIAAANPTRAALTVSCGWAGSTELAPQQHTIGPRELRFIRLPTPADLRPTDPAEIAVTQGGRQSNMLVQPAVTIAHPPGVPFGILQNPLRLIDVQTGASSIPAPASRTTASLRRRPGGWEIFVECLRDPSATEDLVRIELGQEPRLVVELTDEGISGVQPDGVSRPSVFSWKGSDRWRARIEIPREVFPHAGSNGQFFQISVDRILDGVRQTAFRAVGPWTSNAPSATIDLSSW